MHKTEVQSPLFSVSNLSLVYRALPALRGINWEVRKGEQWACIGPNGAGKTSLARVLSGEARRFSGDYVRSPAIESRGVAYVCFEQARSLCNRDRKLDDSEFRADATDRGTSVAQVVLGAKARDERAARWIEMLNLEPIMERGLRYLSTGEMRKTLLVSAILQQPALLILDSPLDGLDAAAQRTMRDAINTLPESGLTLLVLCRQLDDIPEAATHVIALDKGAVAACGARNTVLNDPAVCGLMSPPLPVLSRLPATAERPYTLRDTQPLLVLENVAVSYGDLGVLENVSWTFERGMHCAISGPNGCGKTTLLSLITGDNHKAYGQNITLFGIPRGSGESVWEIKQKFGQLDTQLHLNFARGMKTLEVVISGLFDSVGLYDTWGDAQQARASQWLEALGLTDYALESFDSLSFGLQRVVLLARAMVKSPAILLLDEPTLGLDGHHRQLVLRAIDHIAFNSDTQIIFVSHSPGDLPRCINQFLRFEPGTSGFTVTCETGDIRRPPAVP